MVHQQGARHAQDVCDTGLCCSQRGEVLVTAALWRGAVGVGEGGILIQIPSKPYVVPDPGEAPSPHLTRPRGPNFNKSFQTARHDYIKQN